MTQEAMKLALEALKWSKPHEDAVISHSEAITAIEEALAQPEQEPVAWATKEDFHRELERRLKHIREEMKIKSVTMRCKDYDIALPIIDTDFGRVLVGQVSTPPQPEQEPVIDQSAAKRIATVLGWTPPRTWVGLTDEEIWTVLQFRGYNTDTIEIARAIEARLKERNT